MYKRQPYFSLLFLDFEFDDFDLKSDFFCCLFNKSAKISLISRGNTYRKTIYIVRKINKNFMNKPLSNLMKFSIIL